MFARTNADGSERAPTLEEWQNLLNNGELSSPRDKTPTPLEETGKPRIYGRVAGVATGSQWRALLVDNPQSQVFNYSPTWSSVFLWPKYSAWWNFGNWSNSKCPHAGTLS